VGFGAATCKQSECGCVLHVPHLRDLMPESLRTHYEQIDSHVEEFLAQRLGLHDS
jgi:hypothetical protein